MKDKFDGLLAAVGLFYTGIIFIFMFALVCTEFSFTLVVIFCLSGSAWAFYGIFYLIMPKLQPFQLEMEKIDKKRKVG